MYGRLLVPLDGSKRAETALRIAGTLPSRAVRLLAVEPVDLTAARERWYRGDVPPGGGIWAVPSTRAYLNRLGLPFRDQGHEVETLVADTRPGDRIVQASRDVDLIVMATRGDGASGTLIGRTASHVVRHAAAPTLLIRDVGPDAIRPIERLVVPLDGSAQSEEAIPLAAAMQQTLDVPVSLVRVIDPSTPMSPAGDPRDAAEAYLQRQADALGGRHLASCAVHMLRSGSVGELLAEEAEPGDLLLMASRRRRLLGQVFLGKVATAVARHAPVPVALAPAVPGVMASTLRALRDYDDRDGGRAPGSSHEPGRAR